MISLLVPFFFTDQTDFFYYITDSVGLILTIVSIIVFYQLLHVGAMTLNDIENIFAEFCLVLSIYMIIYYFASGGDKISITPEVHIPMAIVIGAYLSPVPHGYRPSIWLIALIGLACALSQLRENLVIYALVGAVCVLRSLFYPGNKREAALFVAATLIIVLVLPVPRNLVLDRFVSMEFSLKAPLVTVAEVEKAPPPAPEPAAAPGRSIIDAQAPRQPVAQSVPEARTGTLATAAPPLPSPAAGAVETQAPSPLTARQAGERAAESSGQRPASGASAEPATSADVPVAAIQAPLPHKTEPAEPLQTQTEVSISKEVFTDGSLNQRVIEMNLMLQELSQSAAMLVLGKGFGATYENKDGVLIYYGARVHNAHSTPFLVYFRNGLYGVVLYFIPLALVMFTIFSRNVILFRASLALLVIYVALFFNQYFYWGYQFGLAMALWMYCYERRKAT